MSFTLRYDEEHALLRDGARRWLAERVTPAVLRRLAADARGDDPALWRELAALGWTGLVVPEAQGGAGLGAVHLAVLAEESGRRLLPAPLLPTLLAAKLIELAADAAQRERHLPAIARGEIVATLPHVEPDGAWDAGATRATCAGGRISGTKHHVWAAPSAQRLVVPAREGATLRLALVHAGAGGVEIEPERGVDPSRRSGRVRLTEVECELLSGDADAAWRAFRPWAWLALAAEMAGGADAVLALTAAYAVTRVQFDKPIGSFQAIKHPLVNVLIAVEQLRTLVYAAASALDAGDPEAERLARMAKAAASEAYPFACSRAVQFHGGYGFTEDCDAHLYLRRALASRPALGDAREHRAAIAAGLLEGGATSASLPRP
jgi:alkylation response protein AidB-like acyl-CoA dehydrogenase